MQRQYYGIKFPFTNDNEQGYLMDLNITTLDKTRSELLHLILTPKGQRLRDPDFGTDIIRYIYDQNDEITWDAVTSEVRNAVSKYLPYVTLKNIEVGQDQEDLFAVYVRLDFTVQRGANIINDSIAVRI